MTNHELGDEIEQLAVAIEREIQSTQDYLDDLPEYAPRSARSRKMERAFNEQ